MHVACIQYTIKKNGQGKILPCAWRACAYTSGLSGVRNGMQTPRFFREKMRLGERLASWYLPICVFRSAKVHRPPTTRHGGRCGLSGPTVRFGPPDRRATELSGLVLVWFLCLVSVVTLCRCVLTFVRRCYGYCSSMPVDYCSPGEVCGVLSMSLVLLPRMSAEYTSRYVCMHRTV
jgi:hypothetical protein